MSQNPVINTYVLQEKCRFAHATVARIGEPGYGVPERHTHTQAHTGIYLRRKAEARGKEVISNNPLPPNLLVNLLP